MKIIQKRLNIQGFQCSADLHDYGSEFGSQNTLSITLSRPAARAWGAYQPDGVDDSRCADKRRSMLKDIQRLAREHKAARIEIHARDKRGSGGWLVDVIYITDFEQ